MIWMLNEAWVEGLGSSPIVVRKTEGQNVRENAVNQTSSFNSMMAYILIAQ